MASDSQAWEGGATGSRSPRAKRRDRVRTRTTGRAGMALCVGERRTEGQISHTGKVGAKRPPHGAGIGVGGVIAKMDSCGPAGPLRQGLVPDRGEIGTSSMRSLKARDRLGRSTPLPPPDTAATCHTVVLYSIVCASRPPL